MWKSLFLHAALGGTRKSYFAPEERAYAIRSCRNAQSKGDVCSLSDDRMPKGVPDQCPVWLLPPSRWGRDKRNRRKVICLEAISTHRTGVLRVMKVVISPSHDQCSLLTSTCSPHLAFPGSLDRHF